MSIAGTYGAAYTAARLYKIDTNKMKNLIGIAESITSGTRAYVASNIGNWTHDLSAGWAAYSGIIVSQLVSVNFLGPQNALESSKGFFVSFSSGKPDLSVLTKNLGKSWISDQAAFKLFPTEYFMHSVLEALIQLKNEYPNIDVTHIRDVQLSIPSAGISTVCEPRDKKLRITDKLSASYSLPFNAALAISNGQVTLLDYNEKNYHNKNLLETMNKIHCNTSQKIDHLFPKIWASSAVISMKNGEKYSKTILYPRGTTKNPATWEQIEKKFRMLTKGIITVSSQDEIIHVVKNLENYSVHDLTLAIK